MSKLIGIILLVILLSACTVYINGHPYEVSVGSSLPTVTPETFPTSIFTPVPTTTATPLPTSTPTTCTLVADTNINMRRVPGGEIIYVITAGDSLVPDAIYMWNSLKYYQFRGLPLYGGDGWAADFFTEQGNCGGLPVVDPFRN